MKLCVTCDITLFDGATSCGVCGNNDLKSLTKPKPIEEPQVEEPESDLPDGGKEFSYDGYDGEPKQVDSDDVELKQDEIREKLEEYRARQSALGRVVSRKPRTHISTAINKPKPSIIDGLGGGIKSNGGRNFNNAQVNLCKSDDCTMKTVRGSYCPFHHTQYREKYRQRQDKLHKSRNGDSQ